MKNAIGEGTAQKGSFRFEEGYFDMDASPRS